MNDRDTFAAAALAGLLADGDDGSFSEESYARAAYRWADVMLRERDKQPAPPCVETDGFSPGSSSELRNRNAERESPRRECGESQLRDVPQEDNSRAAGGPEHNISEHQLRAHCVLLLQGPEFVLRHRGSAMNLHAVADDIQRAADEIARLRLTDEEREAVEFAICSLGRDDCLNERIAEQFKNTLERLIERLK